MTLSSHILRLIDQPVFGLIQHAHRIPPRPARRGSLLGNTTKSSRPTRGGVLWNFHDRRHVYAKGEIHGPKPEEHTGVRDRCADSRLGGGLRIRSEPETRDALEP